MILEDQALACVQRVLDADNGRDGAAYRALLHDDYHAEVNGAPAATNADDLVGTAFGLCPPYCPGPSPGRAVSQPVGRAG